MNIYLDIDDTLLINNRYAAPFADEFLQLILKHFPNSTYWLTTHCWRGQNTALQVLTPVLKPRTAERIKHIKPTNWGDLKTDAIDFTKPFFWYDDTLYPEEQAKLEIKNALGCFRRMDLGKDPHQLMDEIAYLKQFV